MSEQMDGPVFVPEINEYEVRNNGEVIGYATTHEKATQMYLDALACHRVHLTRNQHNGWELDIPIDGSYQTTDSVTGPQDIGLVSGIDY